MFKRVDEDTESIELEGFSYKNNDGVLEFVLMDSFSVSFRDAHGYAVSGVHYEDIPNMIKALQAAYDDHQEENK